MYQTLNRLFGFNPLKHSIRTEIMAGITSFLTMAYILAVNPNIFSALPDMPNGSVFTATALAAIIGTLVMAFYAKKPFALAPGMGLTGTRLVVELSSDVEAFGFSEDVTRAKLSVSVLVRPELKFEPGYVLPRRLHVSNVAHEIFVLFTCQLGNFE